MILRLTLFYIFIDDLDDGTRCTLRKFIDDKQLGGLVDGCAANKNVIKFNKGNCQVLLLGWNNPMQ